MVVVWEGRAFAWDKWLAKYIEAVSYHVKP